MKNTPLSNPVVRVAPSLLSANFANLERDMRIVEDVGCEILHLDIMDGHFVPNISFGVPVTRSIRQATSLFLDVHLMISDPQTYAEPFVKAGADHITFHAEVASGSGKTPDIIRDDLVELVDCVHELGATAGVSINPDTEVSAIEAILDRVEMVLVMSVWPGFGGQSFIEGVLPKVRQLRDRMRPDQRVQIDGGIDVDTVERAVQAGADLLVAGSAVFGKADPGAAMTKIERIGRAVQAV